ncbi:DUF3120 domain-containing protein [Prochlorococcus sp. MIT 0916]|uniref:DUF3120 domain-containing protein n=1 Tax=Prochlorococcus sp. MIT 0916 TaxID=3082521 RepID=UPI0039B38AE8
MVVLPVFVQAPWVHVFPFSAFLFSFIIFFLGFYLLKFSSDRWSSVGSLLVGVSWSWLGGCLFWGWLRAHPVWHLPVESIALPIAVSLLNTRWKIGASFYLASLLGTAFTDIMIVLTGVMKAWPKVVDAPFLEASKMLSFTAEQLLEPFSLLAIFIAALLIILIANWMNQKSKSESLSSDAWLVSSSALTTTLWVDGLFFATTLIQPQLSGLI